MAGDLDTDGKTILDRPVACFKQIDLDRNRSENAPDVWRSPVSDGFSSVRFASLRPRVGPENGIGTDALVPLVEAKGV